MPGKHISLKGNIFSASFILLIVLNNNPFLLPGESISQTPPPPPDQFQAEMPSQSHEILAFHASQSHGISDEAASWISQGAYDEDFCVVDPYPPCTGIIAPYGFHSWDPDSDGYWKPPLFPSGSGLGHINLLFNNAIQAYESGQVQTAYLWLGRAVHIMGDMATPAHVNLDMHPFGEAYEDWLEMNGLANTHAWISAHPAGSAWDKRFTDLPGWAELNADLQSELNNASQVYGGRGSGQELWNSGPAGRDVILFRLMFLMAEEADNWDSNDVSGEKYHGDLASSAYLSQMRDVLFPLLIPYSAALIDYFEFAAVETEVYLPIIIGSS